MDNNKINPDNFRAYDIRGLVGTDINPSVAETIGKGIGSYLYKKGEPNNIIVGMDNRPSSDELKESLILGLLSTGFNVTDIGLCTSPMMYQTVYESNFSGGVIVSASHNPKEYNGFKIVGYKAYPIASEEIYKLRDLILLGKFIVGQGNLRKQDVSNEYLRRILATITSGKKLRVVLDTGNGVAGKFAPNLIQKMGFEVIEVNCELDGNFPRHLPNPEHYENMLDVIDTVSKTNADIGIGIDGDGDRIGIVNEKGEFLAADFAIILLARDFLKNHPGETVLVDVKSSLNVINEIKNHGGKPLLYKTGHSLIKMKMRKENIMLGGEYSGHLYVFDNYYPFDDALYVAAKILEILTRSDIPLSEHFSSLPKLFPTRLLELECPNDAIKFKVMEKVVEQLSLSYQINDIDGARISYPEGWALIRASNTTPVLTFRAEANSPKSLLKILESIYTILFEGFKEIDLEPLDRLISDVREGRRFS
jgi:phosphomannomutase/phosphoglucomutase